VELVYKQAEAGQVRRLEVPFPIDAARHFVFHRLLNFKKFVRSGLKSVTAGIYDLVPLLRETDMYLLPALGNASAIAWSTAMQLEAGRAAAHYLVRNRPHGVMKTVYAHKARDFSSRYTDFTPADCAIKMRN
jgi:hypothetical protein